MPVVLFVISIIAFTLLGASNPFRPDQGIPTPDTTTLAAACEPQVDKSRILKVDVSSTLDSVYGPTNTNSPGGNKEEKTWVLVKQNAPIPAWKVGQYPPRERASGPKDPNLGEMEKFGTTLAVSGNNNPDADSKDVYIGIGWCDPTTGSGYGPGASEPGCLDPLVQDVIYVPIQKGVEGPDINASEVVSCDGETKHWLACWDWGKGTASTELYAKYPRNQENIAKYWWNFNVYYDASKLPAEPTTDDLPAWMKLQCGVDRIPWMRERCEADPVCAQLFARKEPENLLAYQQTSEVSEVAEKVLGVSTTGAAICDGTSGRPCLIISKNQMALTAGAPTLSENYVSSGKMEQAPAPPDFERIGTAYNNHFYVYYRQGTVAGTAGDHYLVLDPIGHTGPWFVFSPILTTSKPDASSLQLGSFTPGIPSFFYEWWTPACKPALYLYPEQETELTVKVKPEGYITQSIPDHGTNGWNIVAEPNGSIFENPTYQIRNTKYSYLYYEASLKNINVPKTSGWIRSREEIPAFFADILPKLGLNEKEQKDFLEYWIPKLQEGNTWYITLVDRKELDRVEPIEFSKNPDTFIRVRFYFEKLDDNNINKFSLNTEYRILNTVNPRSGFTVVDWGGILGNGSCGIGEVSQ